MWAIGLPFANLLYLSWGAAFYLTCEQSAAAIHVTAMSLRKIEDFGYARVANKLNDEWVSTTGTKSSLHNAMPSIPLN